MSGAALQLCRYVDGVPLRLQHANGVLYVAVEGSDLGAVNIILATDADVWILHSSAALGSARYVPGPSAWSLEHGFSGVAAGSTDSARATLFAVEGWDANIGFTGDLGGSRVCHHLAVGRCRVLQCHQSAPMTPPGSSRPTSPLKQQSELLGIPPPEQVFSTDGWVRLRTTP